jgi:RNA-directed DNA polymerase
VSKQKGPHQGGSISPWAAHLSLHDVLALWAERGRRDARGDMLLVRCADDAIVGCEPRDEAERFWAELRKRCQQFPRARPPEKTRLIECGRVAAERRQRRGQGSPATFALLGFTHLGSKPRTGKVTVRRKPIATRLRKKLQDSKAALRERMHWPIPQQGAWLRRVLLGHYRS